MCKYYASLVVILFFVTSCYNEESPDSFHDDIELRNSESLSVKYVDENANLQWVHCDKAKISYYNSIVCNAVLYHDSDSIVIQTPSVNVEPKVEKIKLFVFNSGSNAEYITKTNVDITPSQSSLSAVINGNVVQGINIIVEETDGF